MSAEVQKLELITWIASIEDKVVLEKLYSVIKTLQPKKNFKKKEASNEAIKLLEEITSAYAASTEPDLNIAQIFTDRTNTNGRNIDFN